MVPAPAPAETALPEQRISVRHEPERRRFVLDVGGRRAGFVEYFETGARRVFVHTEVGQIFSGRGLASVLVRSALETTREERREVAAVCPFVRRWLESHEGFEDIAPL
ncbi:GNAT family N-acetyltransferase [Quadrisphaera granulorum]|uniref:GNAT family N-acetyltransferase n=1 Tax=Quadrisphaera granulorum TaxID=317664 RepID=UPI0014726FC1|nr:GNAT family N-acetyltransferase [Quadrisphaera granulorum]